MPGYLKTVLQKRAVPRHIWLLIGDHYEPLRARSSSESKATPDVGVERVRVWRQRWPQIAARHADTDGRPPQYTFFYPAEEYRPELLEPLAEMTHQGIADVEVHLHHDGEGEADFVSSISGFTQTLAERHSLLRRVNGQLVFGFIHGNWALDNSLPGGRFCGLNNEITLLKRLGCYADFTLPSAPSAAQTSTVNSIYWAIDDPERPCSHDRGAPVRVGGKGRGDLLMVQGPLGLRMGNGRWTPRVEAGELAGQDPPTAERVRLWLQVAPQIGEHVFIKLFTHGALEKNCAMLLDGGLDWLFQLMAEEAGRRGCRLHYATAWQVYRAIEELNAGREPVTVPD